MYLTMIDHGSMETYRPTVNFWANCCIIAEHQKIGLGSLN